MTNTYTELENDIKEYLNPTKLPTKILNALNAEFYARDPINYNNLMTELYNGDLPKNNLNALTILYHWLECSDFKEPKALAYLAEIESAKNLLAVNFSSETKYKVLNLWISSQIHSPIHYVLNILAENIDSNNLDNLHQIKWVTSILKNNKTILELPDKRIRLNRIIQNLDFSTLPDAEVVKLMTLYPYLDNTTMTLISWLYNTEEEFNARLATAEALGVVENPDYWVQSLPSKTPENSSTDNLLPVFD